MKIVLIETIGHQTKKIHRNGARKTQKILS